MGKARVFKKEYLRVLKSIRNISFNLLGLYYLIF